MAVYLQRFDACGDPPYRRRPSKLMVWLGRNISFIRRDRYNYLTTSDMHAPLALVEPTVI